MHRTQISIEEDQYYSLRHYAETHRKSISSVIRDLLNQHISNIQPDELNKNPLQQIKGIVSGKEKSVGRNHNDIIYKQDNSRLTNSYETCSS